MSTGHEERVRREFTRQAATFEDKRLNAAFTSGLDWLVESFAPEAEDVVLDVAAGTGHVARALAQLARQVVAGDATALPYLDESFDLVVTRFSVHHFEDPAIPLAEMARVCRAGGRVGVADMVADADPVLADGQDRLERLRDPSHTRMLTLDALVDLLERLGARAKVRESREVVRPVGTWLEQAKAEPEAAAEVARELEAELAGGPATGLRPQRLDGELHFTHTWAVVVGVRA
jgi:SAM-dependent methyltransferase